MTKRTIHIEIPEDWRDMGRVGNAHVYKPPDVKGGVVRVTLQPPPDKAVSSEEEALATFEALLDGTDLSVGDKMYDHHVECQFGRGVLRVGNHPEYGAVGVAMVFGEIMVLLTYEMGVIDLVSSELEGVKQILNDLRIE